MLAKIRENIEKNINIWYFAAIIIIIFSVTAFFIIRAVDRTNNAFVFNEHLQDTAFKIDDTEITLKEAAYYILVIESNINDNAVSYDEDNPLKYWNIYLNDGKGNSNFLRTQAKEDAMNACIRDGIYYIEAINAGIVLTDDEKALCRENAYEQEKLLTGKQIYTTEYEYSDFYAILEKIAVLQKYMDVLMEDGYTSEQLDVGGEYYEKVKAGYDVYINEELWDEITLGELTVN